MRVCLETEYKGRFCGVPVHKMHVFEVLAALCDVDAQADHVRQRQFGIRQLQVQSGPNTERNFKASRECF